MLGKRVAPVIGKLTRPSFSSRNRTAEKVGVANSPRSPLEYVRIIHSPRGVNNYDVGVGAGAGVGVGLGIVAALEKSLDVVGGGIGCDMIIQGNNKSPNCSRNLNKNNRSNPIPVSTVRNCCGGGGGGLRGGEEEEEEEEDVDSLEEYTFVTCRRPGNKSYTRVYYGGVESNRRGGGGDEITELDRRNSKKIDHRRRRRSVFAISPETFGAESVTVSPPSDFLSSCHLCEKKLQGKDIYMYREKAFCSTECRYRQIVTDEYKEKCSTKVVTKSADIAASSPYQNGQLFSTGILAI